MGGSGVLNSCLQAGKEEVDMETGEVESDIKSFQQPGNWAGMYSGIVKRLESDTLMQYGPGSLSVTPCDPR